MTKLGQPDRRRIEAQEMLVLAGVGAGHLVIIALLISALTKGGILPTARAISVFNVADVYAPPSPAPEINAPPIEPLVEEPNYTVVEPNPVTATMANPTYDPFAGATVSIDRSVQAGGDKIAPQGKLPAVVLVQLTAADRKWLSDLASRYRNNRSSHGASLAPAMIEILGRPGGGFTELRLVSSTGAPDVDQALIAAVRLRQPLVPVGAVPDFAWMALPPITFDSEAVASSTSE